MAKKPPSPSALNIIEPPLEMRPCSLLELDGTDCRWPLGEVHEVAVLFCGASKGPGFPIVGTICEWRRTRAAIAASVMRLTCQAWQRAAHASADGWRSFAGCSMRRCRTR